MGRSDRHRRGRAGGLDPGGPRPGQQRRAPAARHRACRRRPAGGAQRATPSRPGRRGAAAPGQPPRLLLRAGAGALRRLTGGPQGETLALLGTNGAGKSTLLRVISGLEYADRGAVRVSGRTVTYADPATRVRLGIVQVPGGRSVYPNLSVSENLLIGGYTLLGDSRDLEERAREVLDRFPILRQRLDQPAGTLSGGEQQMLGLATAMLLRPEILLIDELSLGLSPVMVQEVLSIVEGLKADGVTMVIVEQSVKIALSIADRAVFMEKGQVRFEGPAQELAHRDDLVRAVFLGTGGA
ncbi:ABC transporter ATP-binding protein [Thermocatellispora tengchongensis]|uniref:ABC transporter ATP-binding protein n=1 Tax=Thermocatellispora tengchongensis TaxID=1073253 RepID=UPI00363C71D2